MVDVRRLLVARIIAIVLMVGAMVAARVAVVVHAVALIVMAVTLDGSEVVAADVMSASRFDGADIERSISVMHLTLVTAHVIVAGGIFGAAVSSDVGLEVQWGIEVEECPVAIDRIDAERPCTTCAVQWTVEVFAIQEAAILTAGQYVADIVIAVIQVFVVTIDGVAVTINDIVHDAVYLIEEVEVNLVDIIVLCWSEVKFVGHAVADEAGVIT